MVDRQDDLWNARGRHRFDKTRTGTDDAAVLRLGTDHHARNILHKKQRRRMTVAVLNKIRCFLGGFGIHDATESRRCAGFPFCDAARICNNADQNTADPRRRADHFLCKISLKFVEFAFVEEARENLFHVIRRPVIFR